MAYDKYQIAKKKLDKALQGNSAGIIMSYTVNTLEDERVRPKCAEFEGYTSNVSNAVIGVNHPPFDEDCRCFATYQIEGIRKK
ncbi:phage putative head morphogenesis protein, SPP1 gp7 family [Bacillus cereus]|nr:phage putative head morphogenesis protein, SPP1 gp7 family [Bacillus cereus]